MAQVRFDPFREIQQIERDIDKYWEGGLQFVPTFTKPTSIDMYEEKGTLHIDVALPKFKKEEVKITTEEGFIEVSASHKEEREEKSGRHYYYRESDDNITRGITLPTGANLNKVDAFFKDGILNISMPLETKKSIGTIEVK